ncbi:aminoglycoside phosphotransferase family protein [Tropicimonas sp. IMCC34043]|uniref:aminoglycoside phosphotransferase family protein n=1 Tax=Tropicimonas sp. IMCC34043 TaxID=2248760 RepID=UPI000E2496E8|nr:phosphotransferase [Tropicimonas sp. IMCC34043]
MTRTEAIANFLSGAGWGSAARTPLAGDASARRYERLTRGGETAVLMDAPPDQGQDVRPFRRIADHLSRLALSPPQILAADDSLGLLLIEDLGDALFARILAVDPGQEIPLYRAAVDVLLALHRHPAPPELPQFDTTELAAAIEPLTAWYLPAIGANAATADGIEPLLRDALQALAPADPVICLRDYHAENLIWLPSRKGAARVGLLDFQDAFAGHPAYDLVSLLQDARRDVAPTAAAAATDRYLRESGADAEQFARACATLGAQRNLRILGIFARLSLRDGKAQYVDLIPRVWGHLQANLAHPGLAALASCVAETVPVPTPDRLQRIKDRCATCPTR